MKKFCTKDAAAGLVVGSTIVHISMTRISSSSVLLFFSFDSVVNSLVFFLVFIRFVDFIIFGGLFPCFFSFALSN